MDLLRSLPLGLYLEQPITWLHRLDPRVKLAWLLSFLLTPLLADPLWRIALVVLLIAITLSAFIPLRVWRQQMGWLLFLCLLILGLTCVLPDGLNTPHQPRLPADEFALLRQPQTLPPPPAKPPWYNPFGWGQSQPENPLRQGHQAPDLPQPTDYRYVIYSVGPLRITQRSLDLGIRVSTLLFTLIYSTNLYLLTTAPEEVTAALENWMQPLRRLNVPVTEIILTLTLALRFIPLVLEEVQNLIRSVSTRAINWKKLGLRHSIEVWLMVSERLLENLLLRAEQIASAMQVRGFTAPHQHQVQWHRFRFRIVDWIALVGMGLLWAARLYWGAEQ